MNMTLNQLRAFERVVRLGSFHAAANELCLTQPSVSQRIKELEAELETPLFIRRGPRIALTADGHALVEYADRMLATAGAMVERFRTRDPLNGTLRIGLSENFALICLPDLFARLEQRYPAIKASVFVGDSGILCNRLNEQELDIAIVSEADVEPHVHQESLGRSRLGWFASADAGFGHGLCTPAQLAAQHLMICPPTAALHQTIAKWFANAGVTPERVSTCNNVTVTIEAIRHGTAVGLIPMRTMKNEIAQGRVQLLSVTPEMPLHRISICYQSSAFGPALKAFVDLARELAAFHKMFDVNLRGSTPS